MVVNGVTWPTWRWPRRMYRFRLLNGCNSRFLNLSLRALDAAGDGLGEVPFYQIGAEQSLLPNVVEVKTGFKTVLPGDGTIPNRDTGGSPEEALLMGLAERADVIVDFSDLPTDHRVRMINTAPDAPFGGFPVAPADPATTGQVMEFVHSRSGAARRSGGHACHRTRESGAEPARSTPTRPIPPTPSPARVTWRCWRRSPQLVCVTRLADRRHQLRPERDA